MNEKSNSTKITKNPYLALPDDPKAIGLLERLDEEFLNWAEGLPTPLDHFATLTSTYRAAPVDLPFMGISHMDPALTGIPWLFWEEFDRLEEDTFTRLAMAGALYSLASVVLDGLLDNQFPDPAPIVLLHEFLLTDAAKSFRKIFSNDSKVWNEFDRLGSEHIRGLALELELRSNPDSYTEEHFSTIVCGKAAPLIVVSVGFVAALDSSEFLSRIESSFHHLAIATCHLDDLWDWEIDYLDDHATYYLSKFTQISDWSSEPKTPLDELRSRLRSGWIDIEELKFILGHFNESIAVLEDLRCTAWRSYIQDYKELAEQQLRKSMAQTLRGVVEGVSS